MKDLINNLWGYGAAWIVWIFDHWSGLAAFTLFAMQAVYQIYRIKGARRDSRRKDRRSYDNI